MLKSQPDKTAPAPKDVRQSAPGDAEAAKQQQRRHRTAVRIAGIEGIDGFADVAERAEAGTTSS